MPGAPSERPAFDRGAYDRFALPTRIGEAIASWDHPVTVAADRADHMRDDDYVIGVLHRGVARAYPLWAIDYHHVVNDRMGGDRIIVTSCERCQSGSAFLAEPPGNPAREPLFRGVGLLDAVLLMKDIRAGTYWNHYDGRGLKGRGAGASLPWIPTYHVEWRSWRTLHPDTEVMLPPDDPANPDARHGHGREESFSRPGVEVALVPTIRGEVDTGYPENEMVLGVDGDDPAAYPLAEVQREGGVVHDRTAAGPIVVFAGPELDGFTMAAFDATVPGTANATTFVRTDGRFVDAVTGSTWTIDGRAVDGPLRGQELRPVRSFNVRWHAWFYVHRDGRLFRSERPWPSLDDADDLRVRHGLSDPGFQRLLCGLTERGHQVQVVGPPVSQRRPNRASRSVTVHVDGHRIHLHRFISVDAARDFEAFEGAWSMLPLKARVGESKTFRAGTLVVQSDPVRRFVDPTQWVQMPFPAVGWWPLIDDPILSELTDTDADDDGPAGPGFIDLVRAIKASGIDVVDVAYLPRGQLRPGCLDAVAMTIDGDPFLVYRFEHAQGAAAYAAEQGHTVAAGPFAFRSTPSTMYRHQGYEILFRGDDMVEWSPLVRSRRFEGIVRAVVRTN
jgi:hypothetical protein